MIMSRELKKGYDNKGEIIYRFRNINNNNNEKKICDEFAPFVNFSSFWLVCYISRRVRRKTFSYIFTPNVR